jgi:transposase
LLKVEAALWTFATSAGVEPTNDAAERALRHAVCWRKTSHGTASAGGSRFVERMLTVVGSCRQQGRDVLKFLTDCVRAERKGSPRPSLIPVTP